MTMFYSEIKNICDEIARARTIMLHELILNIHYS